MSDVEGPKSGKERGNANDNWSVIIDMVTLILKSRYVLPSLLALSFINLATSEIYKKKNLLLCCHVAISVISNLQIDQRMTNER